MEKIINTVMLKEQETKERFLNYFGPIGEKWLSYLNTEHPEDLDIPEGFFSETGCSDSEEIHDLTKSCYKESASCGSFPTEEVVLGTIRVNGLPFRVVLG